MNKATFRMLVVSGAAGLLCTASALPARAALPGDGYIFDNDFPYTDTWNTATVPDVTATDATCFLDGIQGSLIAEPSYEAWAQVVNNGANWVAEYGNDYEQGGQTIGVACVWSTTNVIPVFAPGAPGSSGSQTVPVTGTDANSQCFLQGFVARDGSFANPSAKAVLSRSSGGAWTLTTTGLVDVDTYAVCVDVLPSTRSYEENNYHGTYTVKAFEETKTAREVCGLRGISGTFDFYSSIQLNHPTDPGYWSMTTSTNPLNNGWLTCLQ